ncbi:MAG: signal transduction histidine kinase [Paracoccaceae bacterium]|jgi:signal transduction histidine kinase
MLDRIEALHRATNHLSDTIAHESRTPLTSIQTRLALAALALAGCAITNDPINVAMRDGQNAAFDYVASDALADDSLFVGLAFSGGGMRASAFAYGMLQ